MQTNFNFSQNSTQSSSTGAVIGLGTTRTSGTVSSSTLTDFAKRRYIKEMTQDTYDKPAEYTLEYEPEEYSRHIKIQPILVDAGQRVKIKIITEKGSPHEQKLNIDPNVYRIIELERLLESLERDKQDLTKINSGLTEKLSFIENDEKEEREVNIVQTNREAQKMINLLSSFSVSLFMFSGLIFLILAIFNVIIPRTDSVFALVLSVVIGMFFKFDQIYRRTINNEA